MRFIRLVLLVTASICVVSCSNDKNSVPGYIEGRYIYAASYASGYLEHLNVHCGQKVKAGDVLFVLNNEPESDELAGSISNAAATKELLLNMQLGKRPSEIDALKAQIRGAQATQRYSIWEYKGNSKLYKENAISLSDIKGRKAIFLNSKANVDKLKANLVTANLGARIHEKLAQRENYKTSLALVKRSKWALSTKTYLAPKSGFIDDTFYREGEFISSNQAVLSLLAPSEVKVIFFVPATQLGAMKMGEKVRLECEGCEKAEASIDYIGSQAEYTPPVLYTRQARKSLVFRIEASLPKKIALNYHPGQPLTVYLPIHKGGSSAE